MAVWGPVRLHRLIKVVVLGFLSRQDKDLPDAYPSSSGQSVEFRKAPLANSLGRLLPGDCWIGWNLVVRTHIFSDRLVSGGGGAKLCYLLPS
jgi:hypothetical protein